ncbi:hypothetical protein NLJ89_g4344 [Agrocybe chaxingu]|uniref:Uncharacterized protein n=1 Tax=Agrocybe chaxingu TaxID=84603 RepID=A0A9W8K344_9AGAR|nr:hypothetical protein NLJ89_g4344 [Agrocybe chaxingu]
MGSAPFAPPVEEKVNRDPKLEVAIADTVRWPALLSATGKKLPAWKRCRADVVAMKDPPIASTISLIFINDAAISGHLQPTGQIIVHSFASILSRLAFLKYLCYHVRTIHHLARHAQENLLVFFFISHLEEATDGIAEEDRSDVLFMCMKSPASSATSLCSLVERKGWANEIEVVLTIILVLDLHSPTRRRITTNPFQRIRRKTSIEELMTSPVELSGLYVILGLIINETRPRQYSTTSIFVPWPHCSALCSPKILDCFGGCCGNQPSLRTRQHKRRGRPSLFVAHRRLVVGWSVLMGRRRRRLFPALYVCNFKVLIQASRSDSERLHTALRNTLTYIRHEFLSALPQTSTFVSRIAKGYSRCTTGEDEDGSLSNALIPDMKRTRYP